MIVKAYRTAKCINVDTYETDEINIQFDDPEDARESIQNGWEPMLNFTTDGGYTWKGIPMQLVIEIKGV